jgi:hypothetical protein
MRACPRVSPRVPRLSRVCPRAPEPPSFVSDAVGASYDIFFILLTHKWRLLCYATHSKRRTMAPTGPQCCDPNVCDQVPRESLYTTPVCRSKPPSSDKTNYIAFHSIPKTFFQPNFKMFVLTESNAPPSEEESAEGGSYLFASSGTPDTPSRACLHF